MSDPICRDCRVWYFEPAPDPAPGLCTACYSKRLERITPLYVERLERGDNPVQITLWMAQALEQIAGETPEFARRDAYTLLQAMLQNMRDSALEE